LCKCLHKIYVSLHVSNLLRMSGKEVTITDLAEKLGISYATVSRSLADHPRISQKTKERVTELAAELGYRPNHYARNLRDKKTSTLGVIVPRLDSVFMSAVIAGMEDTAQANGYNLLISQSSEQFEIEQQSVKTMYNSRVDGLMVSVGYQTTNGDHFALFTKKGVPVVFFDRCTGDEEHAVIIDNERAGYEATQHLIGRNCKKILHITADSQVNVYKDRLSGFREALLDNGLSYHPEHILYTDLSYESGVKAAQKILEMSDRPDGVFAANDSCAVGCMIALKGAGIKIPSDIAFVGFNNDLIARVIEPQLSTINYPAYAMGAASAQELINRLNQTEGVKKHKRVVLQSGLIVRGSSERM